jgi:hypothetical protein
MIARFPNRRVAFGMGLHPCPGPHLAGAEFNDTLTPTLSRLPHCRLVEDAQGAPPLVRDGRVEHVAAHHHSGQASSIVSLDRVGTLCRSCLGAIRAWRWIRRRGQAYPKIRLGLGPRAFRSRPGLVIRSKPSSIQCHLSVGSVQAGGRCQPANRCRCQPAARIPLPSLRDKSKSHARRRHAAWQSIFLLY